MIRIRIPLAWPQLFLFRRFLFLSCLDQRRCPTLTAGSLARIALRTKGHGELGAAVGTAHGLRADGVGVSEFALPTLLLVPV